MEIIGEFISLDTDKGVWSYFKRHWSNWFPNLGSRANFAKQSNNLWLIKQLILGRIINRLGTVTEAIHLVDGFPIPVCHFARAIHCALFKGEAQYGHCAASSTSSLQEKINLLWFSRTSTNWSKWSYCGFYVQFDELTARTAANVDERESLWDLTNSIRGLLIGDKGYI
jgi:hypothetical protein